MGERRGDFRALKWTSGLNWTASRTASRTIKVRLSTTEFGLANCLIMQKLSGFPEKRDAGKSFTLFTILNLESQTS